MPKLKLTKTALKAQRDALKQFRRFLPTLQLKKQQLQMEMRTCQAKLRKNEEEEKKLRTNLDSWVSLFGSPGAVEELAGIFKLEGITSTRQNVAGVNVPVFKGIQTKIMEYDLFQTDFWYDDALTALAKIFELRAEHEIIEEQYRLIGHELRVTTQRVNLFEKVKIPECRDNIRKIQIYLGDMDTAGVARSKIAKRKTQETAA